MSWYLGALNEFNDEFRFFFHRVYSNILNDFKKQEFGAQG